VKRPSLEFLIIQAELAILLAYIFNVECTLTIALYRAYAYFAVAIGG